MCQIQIYIKACGCITESVVGRCLDAIDQTGGMGTCPNIQRRPNRDTRPCQNPICQNRPLQGNPSSRAPVEVLDGTSNTSRSGNQLRDSSSSHLQQPGLSRSQTAATERVSGNNDLQHFNPTAPEDAPEEYTEEPYGMPEHRSNVGGYQSHNRDPFRFYQNRSSSNRTAYYTPDGPGQGSAFTPGGWSEKPPGTERPSRIARRKADEDKDVQRR